MLLAAPYKRSLYTPDAIVLDEAGTISKAEVFLVPEPCQLPSHYRLVSRSSRKMVAPSQEVLDAHEISIPEHDIYIRTIHSPLN